MKAILTAILLLGSLSVPACAQFIGYTSPQTVTQNVATNVTCTGLAQSFPINNLGQTQHFLAVGATGAQSLLARIEGIRNGQTFKMSDTMLPASAGFVGVVTGSGFFPQIQVTIQCSPITARFTAGYTGTWGTPIPDVGDYLLSNLDRMLLDNAPASVSTSNFFQTPYGNAAGAVHVRYSGAVAGGGSLQVVCSGSFTSKTLVTGSLAATTATQTFIVSAAACANMTVIFGNSGAAGVVAIEYVFSKPGFLNVQSLNTFSAVVGTGTTVKLVALSQAGNIHVSSYSVTVAGPSITTATNLFVGGTGATCGTGTATVWRLKTGIGGATNDTFQLHQLSAPAGGQLFEVGNNQDLCYTDAGTGVGSVVNGSYEVF